MLVATEDNKLRSLHSIELGCGENQNPNFTHHIDVRPCEGLNFTCNFEDPLPITTGEYDLVSSRFCIEHLSWRKVKQFVEELFRITKPGGTVQTITANTEAQIEWIKDNPEGWDGKDFFDSASEVIFGSQDYAENAHKNYMSPSVAQKLFRDAGFLHIVVSPYGERATDMEIVANKGWPLNKLHRPVTAAFEEYQNKKNGEAAAVDKRKADVGNWSETGEYSLGEGFGVTRPPEKSPTPVATPPEPAKTSPPPVEAPKSVSVDPSTIKGNNVLPYTREELFDRHYWQGGGKVGGYAREGYWDYPVHNVTVQHILARKPESVLELGCARGYILKKLRDVGVNSWGLEISKHCRMTRICDGVISWDLCKTPWRFDSGLIAPIASYFDLCFSIAVLEHIPEDLLPGIVKEMQRVSKRGLHGVDFGGNDDGFDKTHCFPAGTLIRMSDGTDKTIESVCVDDKVLGVMFDGDGGFSSSKVVRCYRHNTNELVILTLSTGRKIAGTPEHPIKTTRGWVRAQDLLLGDEVIYVKGETQPDERSGRIRKEELYEHELPQDSEQVWSRMELARTLCQTEIRTQEGETRQQFCMVEGRGFYTQEQLSEIAEERLARFVAQEILDFNNQEGEATWVQTFYVDRVSETDGSLRTNSGRSRLHCGDSRWGGVCVSIEGRKQTRQVQEAKTEWQGQTSESEENSIPSYFGGVCLQHRPQNDRFSSREMQWVCSSSEKDYYPYIENAQFSICISCSRISSPASNSSYQAIYDYEEGGSRDRAEVFGTSSIEGEKYSYWGRGMGPVRGMAKIVSSKRVSRVGTEVFNLETSTKNYVANGVLVHNCTLKPKVWWEEKFAEFAPGYPVEIVDKEELERGDIPPEILIGDGRTKLNVGCGLSMFHYGWTNIDMQDMHGFAGAHKYKFLQHDVRLGIPCGTGIVDLLFIGQLLEYLNYDEALKFLRECRRIIRPDGAMRLVVTDASTLNGYYLQDTNLPSSFVPEKTIRDFDEVSESCAKQKAPVAKLWSLVHEGKSSAWDYEILAEMLWGMGFSRQLTTLGKTAFADYPPLQQLLKETVESPSEMSFIVDVIPSRI